MRISDWSSDVCSSDLPTDGALNTVGLPGGPFAYSISGDSKLVALDLSDGKVYEIGNITDEDGAVFADFEGLTFGQGPDAGFLFAIEDSDGRILKIDPSSGAVVDSWDYNDSADVSEPGMAVAIDGQFSVVGDDGL